MRPMGKWNAYAIVRPASQNEICEYILANADCFQVSCGVLLTRLEFICTQSLSGLHDRKKEFCSRRCCGSIHDLNENNVPLECLLHLVLLCRDLYCL